MKASLSSGMQGLWRGTLPGQLLTIPYTAVQFVTLQQVRHFAHESGISDSMGGKSLSFVSGAMAGAAATIASYPFDILRTTLAAQGEPKVHHMPCHAQMLLYKSDCQLQHHAHTAKCQLWHHDDCLMTFTATSSILLICTPCS